MFIIFYEFSSTSFLTILTSMSCKLHVGVVVGSEVVVSVVVVVVVVIDLVVVDVVVVDVVVVGVVVVEVVVVEVVVVEVVVVNVDVDAGLINSINFFVVGFFSSSNSASFSVKEASRFSIALAFELNRSMIGSVLPCRAWKNCWINPEELEMVRRTRQRLATLILKM